MEVSEIVKALRMCCDAGVEQTPELLHEAADALEKLKKDLAGSKRDTEFCRKAWHSTVDETYHYLDIINKIREIDESSVKEACIALGDTKFGYQEEDNE